MTISQSSLSSQVQAGSTSVAFRAPASLEATDYIEWFTVVKYPPAIPDVPTGFTHLISQAGGAGTNGNDSGQVLASCFVRVSDGTEDGAIETINITGGNSATSRSVSYARSDGTGWLVQSSYGEQNTASDAWSVTSAAMDLAPGDVLTICIAKNGDADHTNSNVALSASGITFSAFVSLSSAGTTQGDDCHLQIGYCVVDSGTGNVSITLTLDSLGSGVQPAGVVLFVRKREEIAAADPALCLDSSGQVSYKAAPAPTDLRLFLNNGARIAKTIAGTGDRLLTLGAGGAWQAGAAAP